MKIVKYNKHFIFSVFFLLITVMSWGQAAATFSGGGTGSKIDPYVMLTVEDWDAFANSVNAGHTYEKEFIRLGSDIGDENNPITTIVGICNEPEPGHYVGTMFDGNFDGAWHTIYVDIKSDPDDPNYTAPFAWVNGATICNLTVTGKITTEGQYTGGIVSCYEYDANADEPIIMENCTSSVEIVSRGQKTNHGGLVGWICSGIVEFENCIFVGKIKGNTENCAGFVGLVEAWKDRTCQVIYNNCTQAYTEVDSNGKTTFGTYHLPDDPKVATFNNAYYINRIMDDKQGIPAEITVSANVISKKYIRNKITYYVPDPNSIPTLDTKVTYLGTLPIKYYGKRLQHNEDYTIADDKISGRQDYAGEKSIIGITFEPFKQSGKWDGLKSTIEDLKNTVTITLDADYTDPKGDDDALEFNINDTKKTVTLNLNGYTLDKNRYDKEGVDKGYVLSVEENTKLIINGPGVITGGYTKGKQGGNPTINRGDGGGIHVAQSGNLTLNNVTVTKNKTIRSAPQDKNCTFWGTGAGIYSKGTLIVNNCTIINNIADGGGGGICNQGKLTGNNTLISSNVAQSKGGGIRNNGTMTLDGCIIRNNILRFMNFNPTPDDEDGGGIYFQKAATLKNCIINGNNVLWRGGGMFLNSVTVTMKNCEMKYNSALGDENVKGAFDATGGGGAYVLKGTLDLEDTEITDNTSYTTGGVYLSKYYGENTTTLKIKGKTIINNNIGDAIKPNVYLAYSAGFITVNGKLASDALIGVSRAGEDETSYITSQLKKNGNESNFRSDNYKLYWFILDDTDGELKLQKTKYWHNDIWSDPKGFCYYNATKKIYRIDAPVIVNTPQDISEDTIVFKDAAGNPSTRAAIFIDQTKEKVGNSWVQHDGQLVYDGPYVKVSVLRNISAAEKDGDKYGWYTISSPVETPLLLENTNYITAVSQPYNFDLLRFNAENQEFPWQTYVAHPEFTTLEEGRGYLYRNNKGFVAECTGNMITGAVNNIKVYKGWNLIGNPYTHDIEKGADCAINNGVILAIGYYQLSNSGKWAVMTDNKDVIKMGEGLLVKAITNGNLTISNIAPKRESKSRANDEYIQFSVANSEYEDATYAVFNDGYGLDKISHRNPDIPMIYINQNGEDYAIATMNDEIKTFNLNFKAKTTGKYTLRCKSEGDFSYLHIIDRLTGKDIDMLADEEYSFMGSPKDTDARFIVRLNSALSNANNDIFAYQSESDIVVYGEGELQVFDVTGRHIMTTTINGIETIKAPSSGVYILRLIGNDIKTQKIVVR